MLLLPGARALAQKPGSGGPPNAMQGFSNNKGQPVNIEAAALEVRDKDKTATFSGNVHVIQGDTTLKTQDAGVHYEGESQGIDNAKTAKAATGIGPSGEQSIKQLEARGDVVVTQNDQVATGDLAMFDMGTNMVTMTGNVVLTQGQNVLRGQRLVVDMTTGFSRVESGSGRQRPGARPVRARPAESRACPAQIARRRSRGRIERRAIG